MLTPQSESGGAAIFIRNLKSGRVASFNAISQIPNGTAYEIKRPEDDAEKLEGAFNKTTVIVTEEFNIQNG